MTGGGGGAARESDGHTGGRAAADELRGIWSTLPASQSERLVGSTPTRFLGGISVRNKPWGCAGVGRARSGVLRR
jgi:hypothetical protein